MTDADSITLSFAELAFILSLADAGDGAVACRRLGVPHVLTDDQLAGAGLASLALRGLAANRDSALELSPQVAAVAAGLVSAVDTATVAVTREDATSLTQLFIGPTQSIAVRPLALGCFRFDGLSDESSLAAVVAALFASALADGPAVLAAAINDQIRITAVNDDGPVAIAVDDGSGTRVELVDIAATIRSIVNGQRGTTT